jgi:beta-phosphoglucomutase-like phosphatase (HAD superfamily)
MRPKAILFGGLGTIAEISDVDSEAWNAAFRIHDVAWGWSWDVYSELMRQSGSGLMAECFAKHIGVDVDTDALQRTQSKLFAARISDGLPLRPGVAEVILWAAQHDVLLGLVTRVGAESARAFLKSTARARAGITFDVAVLRSDVTELAPSPEAHELAINQLGVLPDQVLSIENLPLGVAAASAAGIPVLAYPGKVAADMNFEAASMQTQSLSVAEIIEAWRGTDHVAAE